MRVLIGVQRAGDGWEVTVTGPGLDHHATMRRVEDGKGGHLPAPAADSCPEHDPVHATCLRGVEEVARAYQEVAIRREPSDARVIAQLGRYLFECLLGQETWESIRKAAADADWRAGATGVVELALAWDPEDRDLHRLNWELLHDGKRYLVQGCGEWDVTITRVVRGADADLQELRGFPRVLFAIGAAATDSMIRPGAEILGLLRHIESDGRALHYRILENASPKRLAETVREFRPDAVHFICHGITDGDQSVLLLRPDEPDQQDAPLDGVNLLQVLRVDGELPRVVVLSACTSGGVPRLLGGAETAPLAAQIVQGGVPVVVGMAGEISDLACRLFTRAFGKALVGGMSLAEATAEARHAGLTGGGLTSKSADWAFPAVFMSERVDPARPLVAPGADETVKLVNGWIANYRLVEQQPVFCGRTEFFTAYWEMLRGEPAVLVATASGEGVGQTRLLRELAKQALRDGHVPLLLGTDPHRDLPRDLPGLRRSVEYAVMDVREWLDLPTHVDNQLSLLHKFETDRTLDGRLDARIEQRLRRAGDVTPEAARRALQRDLARLAADARAKHEYMRRGGGRVIVLLGGIDDSAFGLVEALYEWLLGVHGLGTVQEPVPVVLAGHANVLRPLKESGRVPLRALELRPFQPNGEDLLAYEQVMLHPFNHSVMPGVSDKRWCFNRKLALEDWKAGEDAARRALQGRPAVFRELTFYAFLVGVSTSRFVMVADDDHVLATFREGGPRP